MISAEKVREIFENHKNEVKERCLCEINECLEEISSKIVEVSKKGKNFVYIKSAIIFKFKPKDVEYVEFKFLFNSFIEDELVRSGYEVEMNSHGFKICW